MISLKVKAGAYIRPAFSMHVFLLKDGRRSVLIPSEERGRNRRAVSVLIIFLFVSWRHRGSRIHRYRRRRASVIHGRFLLALFLHTSSVRARFFHCVGDTPYSLRKWRLKEDSVLYPTSKATSATGMPPDSMMAARFMRKWWMYCMGDMPVKEIMSRCRVDLLMPLLGSAASSSSMVMSFM